MNIQQITDQIPDTAKVGLSVSPTMLTIFGYPVEQWAYVASAVVSLFFIVEKLPIVWRRMKELYKLIKNTYASKE